MTNEQSGRGTVPGAPEPEVSRTYAEARRRFLDAATGAGARLSSFDHPLQGPAGEGLGVDVASLGDPTAPDVILVVSATHGVEGYCGSALQTHWLSFFAADRPAGVRVEIVHALNPYGMAWVRRVNEDNVDLNRNFIDWSLDAPANDAYDEIAELLVPSDWTDGTQQRTLLELLGLVERDGLPHLQAVISGGQYSDPKGVFYGGTQPTWSHRWLRDWTANTLGDAHRILILDLHTGLGPWGHGELISSSGPGETQFERALMIWPDVVSMSAGSSVSAVVSGDWLAVAPGFVNDAEVTAIAIEYGTVDPVSVIQALRADACLHGYGDPRSAAGDAVRAQVRAAFLDDDPRWIATCWSRFHDVISAAFGHLATT